MKLLYTSLLLLFINIILFTGCVEPYPPPVSDEEAGFLVVDAFLNSTTSSIEVTLSRAIPLSSTEQPLKEIFADVVLEDSDGNEFPLTEQVLGTYVRTGLTVDLSKTYRLHIRTSLNERYESDFIEIKESPIIDDVTWKAADNGVKILVDTHDDNNNTTYYQWSFEETYEQHAAFYSAYKYENGGAVFRPSTENIYACWKMEPSQNILIGTSQRLSQDIINDFPVTLVAKGSEKLYVRYSILVKQRALTKEAYEYFDMLKRTTEDLGGLFDPQPGQVTGNFRNSTDPKETVLGYFTGGSENEKRIFIKYSELPDHLQFTPGVGFCVQDSLALEDLPNFQAGAYLLVTGIYEGTLLVGYTFTETSCADCRRKGGITLKPSFW